MARIKISLPEQFNWSTLIPVRISDINYGGHVGNDAILSLLHEARIQFLRHHGYAELDLAGVALIMGDVIIEFKKEVFYGSVLRASVTAGEFTRVGFDLFYKLEIAEGDAWRTVALARTGLVCYDYAAKKVVSVPEEVCERFSGAAS